MATKLKFLKLSFCLSFNTAKLDSHRFSFSLISALVAEEGVGEALAFTLTFFALADPWPDVAAIFPDRGEM